MLVLLPGLAICFSFNSKSRSYITPENLLEPTFLTLEISSFQTLVIYLREAPLIITHLILALEKWHMAPESGYPWVTKSFALLIFHSLGKSSHRLKHFKFQECESESHSVVSDSLRPHGLYSAWNSPGVSYPFSSGSSWPRNRTRSLLHCRGDFLPAKLPGKPKNVIIS